MNQEQINEVQKAAALLQQAREHIDNARFNMGHVDENDRHFVKSSTAYDYICKALDQIL